MRRLFTFASAASFVLCLATVIIWASSEWVEGYLWAGQPGPRSAVIACELGHVVINTCDDRPGASSWHMAFERLGTHAYRTGVVFRNPRGPTFSDSRGFNTLGIALIHARGQLIMPPAAGAMNSLLPAATVKIFRISLAWPLAITAVLPVIFGVRRAPKLLRPHRRGHCPACG
jgi:hypothetical protein